MSEHISVLLPEALSLLHLKEDGIYLDLTLGRGGHSAAILSRIPYGHLYAFDLDETAIAESRPRLEAIGSNFTLIHDNFANAKAALERLGVDKVDGILMDLGVSSPQFDDGERGFSYRYDAPLDMRGPGCAPRRPRHRLGSRREADRDDRRTGGDHQEGQTEFFVEEKGSPGQTDLPGAAHRDQR